MAENEKPWPESPPILRERAIIQRGMQFYFSCKTCELLGWDKGCKSRNKCGFYLYQRLKQHFEEWEKVGKGNAGGSLRR